MLTEQKLTQVNVQYVMETATTLINEAVKQKVQQAISFLQQRNGSMETDNHDRDALIPLLDYKEDPFVSIRNQYGQNNYFATHFGISSFLFISLILLHIYLYIMIGMIEPVRIALPVGAEDFGRHRTGRDQSFKVKDYFYVPLLTQLEKILNFTDVSDELMFRKPVKKNEFSYFENGSAFNENTLFKLDRTAIQFHLYLDDASITADKGNRSKKNKLMFIYFALGNLGNRYRSTFKSINLLSIIRTETVTRFGLNVLLRPIVDDLKKLEEGVLMTIRGKQVTVRGTLAAVIADNLGSHQIGGFKIGFSKGFRKCRFCMGTDDQIQSIFLDALFEPRTREQHNDHCASLANVELREHFQRQFGITGDCILNELAFFHVIGGLVPDVMHDLLEGILPLVISKMILHFIKRKFFTLDQLNNKIKNFKYGYHEVVNKPCSIDRKQLINGKINQTASQMWLLAVNLPIMISSFIDESDSVWHCFTVLLRICRLVFLDSISQFQVYLLQDLIEEFLIEYKENFFQSYKKNDPKSVLKCRITPKMHHLVHYPRFIKLLGPLKPFWCMRFEAKHSYFKSLQRKIKNFINPPFTLAMRHQQWQCKKFKASGDRFLELPILTSPFKASLLSSSCCAGQIGAILDVDSLEVSIRQYKWVSISSIKFKINACLILCPMNSHGQAFGMISNIVSYCGKFVFMCEMYRTVSFDNKNQSFLIEKRTDCLQIALNPLQLKNFDVYHFHSASSRSKKLYVPTKTEIHRHVLL
jgi:hypothetical protein